MSKVIERILSRIPSYKKRMMSISFDIAAQIYEYMKKDGGITQKEFAKKMSKKESEISKWLSGGHNFTIETIAKIEEVFNEKIVYISMFAKDDLGLEYENPDNVIINSSPVLVSFDYTDTSVQNSNYEKYYQFTASQSNSVN